MQLNEFLGLQKTFGQELLNFEHFKKNEYILNALYLDIFYDYIIEESTLINENLLMTETINLVNEGKSDEEIEKMLKEKRLEFSRKMVNYSQTRQVSAAVKERLNSLSKEEADNIENIFAEFILSKHPAFNMFNISSRLEAFNQLEVLYYQNNIEAFNALLELQPNLFIEPKIPSEEHLDVVARYYIKTIDDMYQYINERKDGHPFNKQQILSDQMFIIDEKVQYELKLKDLKEINQALNKDLELLTEEDVVM